MNPEPLSGLGVRDFAVRRAVYLRRVRTAPLMVRTGRPTPGQPTPVSRSIRDGALLSAVVEGWSEVCITAVRGSAWRGKARLGMAWVLEEGD